VPMPKDKGEGAFALDAKAQKKLPGQARELRDKANKALSKQDEADFRLNVNSAAAVEQTLDLLKSREEILAERGGKHHRDLASNDGPSVTYPLAGKITIPSRNDEQVVEVAKLSLAPKYYYKVVPVLNRSVYRLADLTNTSKLTLLPGEATMCQGNDFVGRMTLPLVAIGEEFTAGFGVEPQLQVQREMLDKTREMQGGNQVLTFKYRMLVSSFKQEKVKLQVWDRLPFAEREVAGIDVIKSTPDLSKDPIYQRESKPQNLLRWDLDVEPKTNGEHATPINYEFRLQLDRNMIIGNEVRMWLDRHMVEFKY
jgi:uncharacterized protein (TIGR02231 family)